MKIWILLILALLLILWGVREGFEATQSIKAPPYGDSEKARIFEMIRMPDQDTLIKKAKAANPSETNQTKLKKTAGEYVIPAIESFFKTVYKPATVSITKEDVKKFMLTRSSDIALIEEDALTKYFVKRSGYLENQTTATSPTPGTKPNGLPTTSAQPNSRGGGDRRKQVFGPQFTSIGEIGTVPVAGGGGVDSSITNKYPELLGGMSKPSKNTDNKFLPTSEGLGATEDSKFFPTSRVPGDMDLIPDPYRVSQTFSSASYGSKTEPLPFLTDFSAFLK
jgi:hypothetical protein